MGSDLRFNNVPDVGPVGGDRNNDAYGDGEEGKAHLAKVEVVHDLVDEREGLEEAVEDSVDEGCIDCRESDTGVEDHELEGTPEGFNGNFARCHLGLLDLGLRLEARITGEGAKARGAAKENVGGRSFGEEEEQRDKDRAVHPEHLPLRPVPVLGRD